MSKKSNCTTKEKISTWMPAFAGMTAIFCLFFSIAAHAEQEKRYNFSSKSVVASPEVKAEETTQDVPQKPDIAPKDPETRGNIVNGVYSPNANSASSASPPDNQSNAQKAEKLVRFFIGTCLKFYGRNADMVKYMDERFPALDTDRKEAFASTVSGNINTRYWDVVMDGAFYIVTKDTSSGKCDVIAKEGASPIIHKELKAVMDGLTLTDILKTHTDYEKIESQNKEVSMVNIQGHPLEKELGIVATSKIKDDGDNVAALLTLFTVPQETVEIK